jgi:membrane-bound ClpP family serine protease
VYTDPWSAHVIRNAFVGFGYLLAYAGTLAFIVGCVTIMLGEFAVTPSAFVVVMSILIALLISPFVPSHPPTISVQVFCALFMQLMAWIVIVTIRGLVYVICHVHRKFTAYVEGVRNEIVLIDKLVDN